MFIKDQKFKLYLQHLILELMAYSICVTNDHG